MARDRSTTTIFMARATSTAQFQFFHLSVSLKKLKMADSNDRLKVDEPISSRWPNAPAEGGPVSSLFPLLV